MVHDHGRKRKQGLTPKGGNVIIRVVLLCGFLLCWGGCLPVAADTPSWTLESILERAMTNNARIEAQTLRHEAAKEGKLAARGALLPKVTASVGLNKIENPHSSDETNSDYISQTGRTWRVGVQQNIFDGFGRWNTYNRADLIREYNHEQLKKNRREIALEVRKAYFSLLRIRADIAVIQASVERLEMQKEAAVAFFEARVAPRLHILQTETALAEAYQRLSRAQSDEQIQLVVLSSLMGLAPEKPINVVGNLEDFAPENYPDIGECLFMARENLPEIKIAGLEVDVSKRDMKTARSRFSPSVDVYADYVDQKIEYGVTGASDLDRSYYTLGVNVTWELFAGGSTLYETRRQRRTMESAEASLEDVLLSVDSRVRETYLQVKEAENQIRIAHIRKADAREAYEQANMRMRMGTGTSLDLLDAQEKVTVAEASLNQGMADYHIALANLRRFIGQEEY